MDLARDVVVQLSAAGLRIAPAPENGTVEALRDQGAGEVDIVAIHALCPRARFVSKADVKSWPVLNRLVAAADSLYLERERRRDAMRVMHHIGEALVAGDMVAVFPEGTTGAGHDLLPFHANLLQAAIATGTPLQPVALRFSDAAHAVSPAVAYVGDTRLLQGLWWDPQTATAVTSPPRPTEPASRDAPAAASAAPVRTHAEAGVMWIPL